jgi:hypothetical protein
VPKEEKVRLIKEVHTSNFFGHFGVGKIVTNLLRYVYWLKILEEVTRFIRGYILCCTNETSSRENGLYSSLLVLTRPWEVYP